MANFFEDEVEDKVANGTDPQYVHEDIEGLLEDGYYEGSEVTQVKRGLIRVGYLVEIPEPEKREVTTLSGSGCRTTVTNADQYDYRIGGRYYIVKGTER